jgi:predicted nucleic acid-binding protein
MRVLLDTNFVLDVLLDREPGVTAAKALWQANDEGRLVGFVTASAMTDIFYVARRLAGLEVAHTAVDICLAAFEICAVDRQALEQAIALSGRDFEDNLQIACAHIAGLEAIVTRDAAGFKAATIPILTPTEALAQLTKE